MTKTCNVCKEEKLTSEFYVYKKSGTSRSYCKLCSNVKTRNFRARLGKIESSKRERSYLLKFKYSMTEESYNELLEEQGHLCAICDAEYIGNRKLHIDHDHKTGKVRGLLCWDCNKGLGDFEDNIKFLENAIAYLRKSNGYG